MRLKAMQFAASLVANSALNPPEFPETATRQLDGGIGKMGELASLDLATWSVDLFRRSEQGGINQLQIGLFVRR